MRTEEAAASCFAIDQRAVGPLPFQFERRVSIYLASGTAVCRHKRSSSFCAAGVSCDVAIVVEVSLFFTIYKYPYGIHNSHRG